MSAPARLSGLAGEALELHYVDLDAASLWDRNPKRHDLGAIAASIRRYGFKDPPKWEPAIGGEGVAGGFVEGNGRTEVLRQMRDAGEEVPRGILLHGSGRWAMPVLFGIDSASRAEAEAYAIDHNNLVVGGGDTSLGDMVRLWDRDALMLVLLSAAAEEQAPVSIDASDIELLLAGPPPGSDGIGAPTEEATPVDPVEVALKLAERFGAPPFSVLDARQGYWQDRKRAWLALGIESELGRGGAPGGSPRPAARLTDSGHTERGDGRGRAIR